MTAIAGIIHDGRVHLAGDSALSYGWRISSKPGGKLWSHGAYVLGVSGSLRALQLLQHAFTPTPPPRDPQLAAYMSTAFVDAMRTALKDGGHARKSSEEESAEMAVLVGVRGRLFKVDSGYGVSETPAAPDPFDAVGCGAEFALGSLHTTAALGWPPRKRLRAALEAASRFSGGVRPPFTYSSTPKAAAA